MSGSLEIELKQLITKFANDVIATCALGVKVDTLKNPDNIFYKMGQKVSNLSGFWKSITLLGFIIAPRLMKLLNAKIIEENCANFFTKLVTETMAKREKEGITRLDMIHLLMKARKGALHSEVLNETSKETESYAAAESHADKLKSHKRAWTDVEITGQVLLFFFAGFESTSTGSCFIAYELAINPDIQRKLQEEIDQVCNEQDSLGEKHLNYEKLHRMKFLDMVVSEGLRKWPPGPYVDRHCNKDYVFEDFDGSKFEMKKGESIVIPIYNLHRDENYFPDPDKFDPYRFNEENKHKIKPFTYVPFGVGPRNCIGSRFALMEIKSLLFGILRNFDILPCEKTQIPMKLAKSSILLKPENGFWLKFQRRSR